MLIKKTQKNTVSKRTLGDLYKRKILRVFAHPTRLQIVYQLVEKRALNVSALQHFLKLPQSTVSQHLHKMRNHKVLLHERKGTEVYYRVDELLIFYRIDDYFLCLEFFRSFVLQL